ncbi:hypothetical protein CBL_10104 [Carabus blaptoides fortunei]
MKEKIVDYCVSDVDILRRACVKFRQTFIKDCGVCPFTEAVTIASACNKVFRRRFLKHRTIGLIPENGYRMNDNQSKVALECGQAGSGIGGVVFRGAAHQRGHGVGSFFS